MSPDEERNQVKAEIGRGPITRDFSNVFSLISEHRCRTPDPDEWFRLDEAKQHAIQAEREANSHNQLLKAVIDWVCERRRQLREQIAEIRDGLKKVWNEVQTVEGEDSVARTKYTQVVGRLHLTGVNVNRPNRRNFERAFNKHYDVRPWDQIHDWVLSPKTIKATAASVLGVVFVIAAGLFLGVALGKITGFVDVSDWEEMELTPVMAAALLFGTLMVWRLGEAMHGAKLLALRRLQDAKRREDEEGRAVVRRGANRRRRRKTAKAQISPLFYVIWAAEIFAESYALHAFALESDLVGSFLNASNVAFWPFILLGTLFVSPYFLYKLHSAEAELHKEEKEAKAEAKWEAARAGKEEVRTSALEGADYSLAGDLIIAVEGYRRRLPRLRREARREERRQARELHQLEKERAATPAEKLAEIDAVRRWSEYHLDCAEAILAGNSRPEEPVGDDDDEEGPGWWKKLWAKSAARQ